jgi:hypothetical protein
MSPSEFPVFECSQADGKPFCQRAHSHFMAQSKRNERFR